MMKHQFSKSRQLGRILPLMQIEVLAIAYSAFHIYKCTRLLNSINYNRFRYILIYKIELFKIDNKNPPYV